MNTITSSSGKAALKKSLTIATGIMMGSVMLSRVAGLFREQVVALFGGTSYAIDSYVTAFFIPELLNHFLAGGFLSVTFIPIFQKYIVASDHPSAWRSFSNLFTIGTIAFCVAIPVMIVFTPDILRLFGPHISNNPENFALTVRLTRIILPAQILFYWGAFFSAVQMAQHKFLFPALAPLCYNLGIISGGLLFGRRFGVEGFAWGVLIGAFVGNVVIQLPGAMKAGLRYKFRIDFSDPDLKKFVFLSIPLVVGLGMTFSNEVFFRFFGSFLGEGGTSSLNYALRIMLMVVAIFGQASGVAFFPYLSRFAAEKKFTEMTDLLNKLLSKIALLAIPCSALFIVLAPQIISILFEHGRFNAASTARTAPIFALYMTGAFVFSAAMIVNRSFYAVQNTLLPMIVGSIVAVVSIPLYFFASKVLGAQGIALSAVFGMLLQVVILYSAWVKSYGDRKSAWKMVKSIVLIIVISALGAAAAFGTREGMLHYTLSYGKIINNMIICTASAIPMVLIIALLYEVTGLQKIQDIFKRLLKKA